MNVSGCTRNCFILVVAAGLALGCSTTFHCRINGPGIIDGAMEDGDSKWSPVPYTFIVSKRVGKFAALRVKFAGDQAPARVYIKIEEKNTDELAIYPVTITSTEYSAVQEGFCGSFKIVDWRETPVLTVKVCPQ